MKNCQKLDLASRWIFIKNAFSKTCEYNRAIESTDLFNNVSKSLTKTITINLLTQFCSFLT